MSLFQELYAEGAFNRRWWRLGGGAIACFLTTYVLLTNVEKDPIPVAAVVVVIEIALVVAVASGVGRRFAVGFIATIISMAIVSKGLILVIPWGLPVAMTYGAAKSLGASATNLGAGSRQRKAWIIARRKEPPALAQGQILTNTVNECAARFRERDTLNSYPRDAAQLTDVFGCPELSASRADSATSAARFSERDYGWRWRYIAAAPNSVGRISGYALRVFEDPVLARASPQYASDGMGEIRQFDVGKPPAVVASPVKSLALLGQCIAQVPAERLKEAKLEKSELEKLRWRVWSNPIDEVLGRCPDLRGHLALDYESKKYGVITLSARGANGKLADTVGVYIVELIPVDAKLFVFEVSASPRTSLGSHAGVRYYFVAREGSIHVKPGEKATAHDPLVSE